MSYLNTKKSGFTIVELLIAITIFSAVLLLISIVMMNIGRTYLKGFTSTKTQATSRSIMDSISQDIQFGGADPIPADVVTPGQPYTLCVGNVRYSISLGNQIRNSGDHALVKDRPNSGACDPNAVPDLNDIVTNHDGTELIPKNMRLSSLSVSDAANGLFSVHVRIVYGDNDLLCSQGTPGDCDNHDDNFPRYGSDVPQDLACKIGNGSQFCAYSDLTTTVQSRIQ